jgi:Na+-transporting NADH:ubiquinone oxidoreductase subunit NqrD
MKKNVKRTFTRLNMIFLRNPILVEGIAVATAVMTTTRLIDATAVCIALWVMALPTSVFVYPLKDKIPNYAKAILYALSASIMYIPAYFLVRSYSQQAVADLTIYLPLLVVSELIMARSDKKTKRRRFGSYLSNTIVDLIGVTLVLFVTAFIREFFSYGTFFGIDMGLKVKIPVVAEVFMGFIVLGFLCAFLRFLYSLKGKKNKKNSPKIKLPYELEQEVKV